MLPCPLCVSRLAKTPPLASRAPFPMLGVGGEKGKTSGFRAMLFPFARVARVRDTPPLALRVPFPMLGVDGEKGTTGVS